MRWFLLPLALVPACSQGPDADLPSISEARSLAAEWALVNRLGIGGKVTPTYADAMRKSIREQLQTASRSLKQPQSAYAQEIAAALREPDHASPAALQAHADKLKRIEDSLESA